MRGCFIRGEIEKRRRRKGNDLWSWKLGDDVGRKSDHLEIVEDEGLLVLSGDEKEEKVDELDDLS